MKPALEAGGERKRPATTSPGRLTTRLRKGTMTDSPLTLRPEDKHEIPLHRCDLQLGDGRFPRSTRLTATGHLPTTCHHREGSFRFHLGRQPATRARRLARRLHPCPGGREAHRL